MAGEVVNGAEDAITIQSRASTALIESDTYTFTEQLEGSTIVVSIETATTVLFELIPTVQDAERSAMHSENLVGPGTFQRAFLFQTGDFKVELTPATQPNTIGAAVRTVQVS